MSGFLPPMKNEHSEDNKANIVKEYSQKSRWVRDGCNFDISKCFNDGKPLIIEGSHIDPQFYCMPSPDQGPKAFHIVTTKSDPKEEANAPLLGM